MYTTTLQALRNANACQRGYDLIANHVGRDFTGNIPLETILDNNGLDDAIWALRATEGGKELAVAFAIYVAEPYYADPAWQEWARKWMSGEDRTPAAADAAYAAAYAAYAAPYAAPYAAARAAYAAERKRQKSIFRRLVRGEL